MEAEEVRVDEKAAEGEPDKAETAVDDKAAEKPEAVIDD